MPLSRYARDGLMDHLFLGKEFAKPGAIYVSLHTAPPEHDGQNEVIGEGYERKTIDAFTPVDGGAKKTAAVVEFGELPACVASDVGFWDAAKGGNFLWGAAMAAKKTIEQGDSLRIDAGNISLGLK